MPQVYDIGRKTFAHRLVYPTRKFPLIDQGTTQEIEYPYRFGRSLVFRAPWSRQAVVVGRWTHSTDEESALRDALRVRDL